MEDNASFGEEEVVNYAYAYHGPFLFLWGKQNKKQKTQCPDRLVFVHNVRHVNAYLVELYP